MKNIQIVDGALNCSYSIYSVTDAEFHLIFPNPEQDIEFIEDVFDRLGKFKAGELLSPVWDRYVAKKDVVGIHGTLFYECGYKRQYYPNRKESDLFDSSIQGAASNSCDE